MSRYLVTGAAGFLGRHVVARLLAGRHKVCAMAQCQSDVRKLRFAGATTAVADLLDLESLQDVVAGTEIVCHCAAKLPGKATPDEIWAVNVTGTHNVVAACLAGGVRRLVYVSTDSVYGDGSSSAATEESPLDPAYVYEGNYPRSKLEGERLVLQAWREHGLEVAILRPCLMYGPGDSVGTLQLSRWASKRIHLLIGGGDCRISLVFVTDVAHAVVLASESPAAVGRLYNVSDGEPHSKREILALIANVTQRRKVFVRLPGRSLYLLARALQKALAPIASGTAARLDPRRILFSITHHTIDMRRIRRELGYEPSVALREGLRRTLVPAPASSMPTPSTSLGTDRNITALVEPGHVHGDAHSTLRISVVIPTFNRYGILATTLDKLVEQTLLPSEFEVLVVDDGSTDETAKLVLSRAPRVPFALRYFRHENRGPGYTQNRGIREARAPLVLLLANDMWATPHLLRRHIEAHERDSGFNIAILGQVQQSAQLLPTVTKRYWDPFAFCELKGRHALTSLHFYACNISFHQSFALENGLFRQRPGAANEDTELGYRLGRCGLRIFYEPAALAYHYHEETIASICSRAYEQGSNFDLLDEIPRSVLLPFCGIFTFQAGLGTTLRTLPKAILRLCLFNLWIVKRFWVPILGIAERKAFARHFACRSAYRGVFGCYFRKGIRDMRHGCSIHQEAARECEAPEAGIVTAIINSERYGAVGRAETD